jgi:zinc/manganese transport system ATP-binding protein
MLFARLMLQKAQVILLDEPFAAVDESTIVDLMALIMTWYQQGKTVIAILHDLDFVRKYFPSTLLLARKVIDFGDTKHVLTVENLAKATFDRF